MNKEVEEEFDVWIKFLDSNPTPGQFYAKVNGKFVSAGLLYALWKTKSNGAKENEK